MARTTVQKYSISIVRGMVEKAHSLSGMGHQPTKGQLRELFVAEALTPFLTSQFGVKTGVVVNQEGYESNQTDILIYDNRILPPFIEERKLGVYPVESVIATIEVKSWLRKPELLEAEEAARTLHEVICSRKSRSGAAVNPFTPLCAVIGFYGRGPRGLGEEGPGRRWLEENVKHLWAICVVGSYSWLHLETEAGRLEWKHMAREQETGEETKRFLAALVDNIRTISVYRLTALMEHQDWVGGYIRDQEW